DYEKDEQGNVTVLHCTYDPETRGGNAPSDGRRVKATLHWVSAAHALDAEVRLYDHLFNKENPSAEDDFTQALNPDSLEICKDCKVEPGLKDADVATRFQFERLGYFCLDSVDGSSDSLVFNRTVSLKDEWARIQKKN
ncbi:MAG: glutamine--tRNA ligase, partial [Chitinivibrionales bacterium]